VTKLGSLHSAMSWPPAPQAITPFRQPSSVTPRNCNAWSCQLYHQPAPCLPLAVLVANPTPPGQVTRERASRVHIRLTRDSSWKASLNLQPSSKLRPAAGPLRRATRELDASSAPCPLYPRCRSRIRFHDPGADTKTDTKGVKKGIVGLC
jgi:hypothetical protein